MKRRESGNGDAGAVVGRREMIEPGKPFNEELVILQRVIGEAHEKVVLNFDGFDISPLQQLHVLHPAYAFIHLAQNWGGERFDARLQTGKSRLCESPDRFTRLIGLYLTFEFKRRPEFGKTLEQFTVKSVRQDVVGEAQ